MARSLGILLLLAVIAAAGWALSRLIEAPAPPSERSVAAQLEPGRPDDNERSPLEEQGASPPAERQAGQPPRPGEVVPRARRDVTPSGVTPGPAVTGPLVRIPVPARPAAAPAPPEPRLERLFKPVVDSAGSIETAAGRLAIADVEAPELEARCGEGAAAWPCGRMARAELRRYIRGRAIECQVPPGADGLPETVRCSVGGDDIGEWLVRQGWARPAGGAYAEAAVEAEASRRGLWGDGER
jgi:endonuclease YncB( thermonuclease family)